MKILITGGCGFLGSNIASKILTESIGDLIIIDNLSRYGSELNYKWLSSQGAYTFYNSNISNQNEIEEIIKKHQPNVIYHLAGQVAMTTSIENPRKDFETNALGTLNILEAVRKFSKHTAIIYSSTNKVYGDFAKYKMTETTKRYLVDERPHGFDESESLNFHSPYGCSKGTADQYLLDYYRLYGIKTVVFRHSSMYGGRQFSTFDQGWVGWFCKKAVEIQTHKLIEPFTISGNGKQVRDLLYADDAVNLYIGAMHNIEMLQGEAFNIGGGFENSMSLLEVFDFLEQELNIQMSFIYTPERHSDQKVFIANNNKILSMNFWQPKIDKIQGLKNNLIWLNQSEK